MSNVYRNGGTIDCVEFFAQADPWRAREIQDFLEDRNGTIHFSGAAVSPDASLCVGSCGRPDEQLMFSESVRVWRSPFAFPDDVHAALLRLSKEEARVESSRQYRM